MKVAIGIIFDAQQRVLVTQRPPHKPYGGYWEFPGGKLEHNEDPAHALAREMQEEIGIQIISSQHWGDIWHEHAGTTQLMIFAIYDYLGMPQRLEHQPDMQWIPISELDHLNFLPANQHIIQLIKIHVLSDAIK